MNKSVVLPSLLVLAIFGCKASSKPVAVPLTSPPLPTQQAHVSLAPPSEPKYGWKEFHAETFETHPAPLMVYEKAFRVPRNTKRLRVLLKADTAILAGAFDSATFLTLPRIPQTVNFRNRPCSMISTVVESVDCDLNAHKEFVFILRDDRAIGAVVGGAFGFLHHSNKLAERAALPNTVRLKLASWECLENCHK